MATGRAFALWRELQLGPDLEGAVIAARLFAGEAGLGALPWVPFNGASWTRRPEGWLAGIVEVADALRHRLYRLADWRAKALAATTDLSGKTPGALIEALVAAPVLSTDTAAEVTGASKAGVRRNLAVLQARGLVSEITGQGRFRVWRAAG